MISSVSPSMRFLKKDAVSVLSLHLEPSSQAVLLSMQSSPLRQDKLPFRLDRGKRRSQDPPTPRSVHSSVVSQEVPSRQVQSQVPSAQRSSAGFAARKLVERRLSALTAATAKAAKMADSVKNFIVSSIEEVSLIDRFVL